jgi:hypothetical protein
MNLFKIFNEQHLSVFKDPAKQSEGFVAWIEEHVSFFKKS